jgi:hypothetical protein
MCNNPDVGNVMFDNFMLIIVFMSLSMLEHSDTDNSDIGGVPTSE